MSTRPENADAARAAQIGRRLANLSIIKDLSVASVVAAPSGAQKPIGISRLRRTCAGPDGGLERARAAGSYKVPRRSKCL
jgi:hypothetical protein